MTYRYLASPYSHKDSAVMEDRYRKTLDALHFLLKRRIWTYSPICQCHELAKSYYLPRDATFWYDYNKAMLNSASALLVLAIEGWDESVGVNTEIKIAARLRLPTSFIHPHNSSYVIRSAR